MELKVRIVSSAGEMVEGEGEEVAGRGEACEGGWAHHY